MIKLNYKIYKKMVKKVLLFGAIVALFASCGTKSGNEEATVVTVNDFETAAVNLVDKNVSVEGTVVHVCSHGGKRMFLSDESGEKRIKIEVSDEQTAFTPDLEGALVKVIGKVVEFKIDEPYLAEWEAELKAEIETTGDTTVKHETDPTFDVEHIHNDSKYEDLDRINEYRKEIADGGKGYIAFYSLAYVSHEVLEAAEPKAEETEEVAEEPAEHAQPAAAEQTKEEPATAKAAGTVQEMNKSEIDAAKSNLNKAAAPVEKEVTKTENKVQSPIQTSPKDGGVNQGETKSIKNVKKVGDK